MSINNNYQLEKCKKAIELSEIKKDMSEYWYQKNSCYLFYINQFIQKMKNKHQVEFATFNLLCDTFGVHYRNSICYIETFLIIVYFAKMIDFCN